MALAPVVVQGAYVFVSGPLPRDVEPFASVAEPEGPSFVVRREDARGMPYDGVFGWITLTAETSPQAVGITAAVSTALARAGIACNVIAGYHHDHLLVPIDRVDDALRELESVDHEGGAGI
jgi:hypothetical protein